MRITIFLLIIFLLKIHCLSIYIYLSIPFVKIKKKKNITNFIFQILEPEFVNF